MFNMISHSNRCVGKCKLKDENINHDEIPHLLEWLKYKTLTIARAEKDAE